MDANYKLPIDFSRLFESPIRNLSIQNENGSIAHNLELILTTSPGEHKYNDKYGCKIWDLDFERVDSKSMWEEKFNRHISEAVKQFEPRICDVNVSVNFSDIKRDELMLKATIIKTRANIRIDAKLSKTGEKFVFSYLLFLGPLNPG